MPWEPSRGYLLAVLLLLVGPRKTGCSTSASRYPVCKSGFEFWSVERDTCWPCTRCAPEFTLSPCTIYKDAICGPLSALELDWSFLSTRKRPDTGQRSLEAVTSKMLWRFPELEEQQIRQVTDDFVERVQNFKQNIKLKAKDRTINEPRLRETTSSEERILWDWQTGALVLAVCACIIFFLAAGCSALVYARQWRRMKKNFEPVGLDEISARLNLIVKAELAQLVADVPMSSSEPQTRCQYLEKLLDRKKEATVMVDWPEVNGNLYIEERESLKGKKLPVTRIHQNIRNDSESEKGC